MTIPFCDFVFTARGNVQPEESANLDTITHLSFLIADKRDGPFQLDVRCIEAFRYTDAEMERDGGVREILERNEDLGYAGE